MPKSVERRNLSVNTAAALGSRREGTLSIERGTIIGVVGTVVGLLASGYFYRLGQSTRIPTFLVDPARAVFAGGSSSATSDITIQYKGHPISQKAVNVVRVYFWNAGNNPITEKEILEPLTITISPNSEILDAKLLKVNRDLTYITFDAQLDKPNTANVNFELLEPNDGAALQITYAGPRDAEFEFHGATIGAPKPTINSITDYSQKIFDRLSPLEKVISSNSGAFVNLYFVLVLSVISTIVIPPIRNVIYRNLFMRNNTDHEIKVSAMRLLLPAIVFLFLLGFSLIRTIPPKVTGAIPSALIVNDLIL